jgi:LysR family cys regulon transcriptional activator
MLEDELGVQIFQRNGKHLTEITPAGTAIVKMAGEILDKVENVRLIANEFSDKDRGTLSIATTHTQARYLLPSVISEFIGRYPDVALHMHQGTPVQISEAASKGKVDIAIATEAMELFENLIMLPCYRWNRSVIVKHDHPLAINEANGEKLTLERLAEYPIVTYVFGFTGRSQLDDAFNEKGYEPKVVFTAADADVIKTYVKLGIGVGIVASMAFDADIDKELVAIDASHLFASSTTKIGLRRGTILRGFMYEFIELFAPHLDKALVDKALNTRKNDEIEQLFAGVDLPFQ